jgi:hypothetical protein
MEKFYVNSVINNTSNKNLKYHILSIEKAPDIDDSIIEYSFLYENANGEKIKHAFKYKALLSDFRKNERKLLTAIIKLRSIIKEQEKKVVLDPVIV